MEKISPEHEVVVWRCSHGYVYSEFEMDMMMTYAAMDAEMKEQELEFNLVQDQVREQVLARQHAGGELDCPWPWYAAAPIEVQRPEVIEW